jgi:CBS domain containing-hemolysin-like protein
MIAELLKRARVQDSQLERGHNMSPAGKLLLLLVTLAHLWGATVMVFMVTVSVMPKTSGAWLIVMLCCLGATFLVTLAGTLLILTEHVPETLAELARKQVAEPS